MKQDVTEDNYYERLLEERGARTHRGTVWVLGAGFSRPLGGPLLHDLFSEITRVEFLERYKEDTRSSIWVDFVFWSYRYGLLPENQFWNNAEGFISSWGYHSLGTVYHSRLNKLLLPLMDKYIESGPWRKLFQFEFKEEKVVKEHLRELHWYKFSSLIENILAHECGVFFTNTGLKTETWSQYLEWAKTLRPCDTILTFNYDMVLELASVELEKGGEGKKKKDGPGFDFLFPLQGEENQYSLASTAYGKSSISGCDCQISNSQKARIVKLHGSLDLIVEGGECLSKLDLDDCINPNFEGDVCLRKEFLQRASEISEDKGKDLLDYRTLLAAPGNSKIGLSKNYLKPLWDYARFVLQRTQHIVFVGYSFPPSDSYPMMTFVNAIRNGVERRQSDKSHGESSLQIDVVLGRNTDNTDVKAMETILKVACSHSDEPGGNRVNVLRAYAQDLFAVWHGYETLESFRKFS